MKMSLKIFSLLAMFVALTACSTSKSSANSTKTEPVKSVSSSNLNRAQNNPEVKVKEVKAPSHNGTIHRIDSKTMRKTSKPVQTGVYEEKN